MTARSTPKKRTDLQRRQSVYTITKTGCITASPGSVRSRAVPGRNRSTRRANPAPYVQVHIAEHLFIYTYLKVIFHSLFTWLLCRVYFKNLRNKVYLFCMFVSSFVSGTCTTGGKIYSVGETVPCYDRVNSCGCISTGQGFSTLIATNKYSLCGAPFPTE